MPKNSADVVGRCCGNDGCGDARYEPRRVQAVVPWPVGDQTLRITVRNLPESFCPACGAVYHGDDYAAALKAGVRAGVDNFWTARLKAAGAPAAVIIRLKMLVRQAVADFEDTAGAAGQLGAWLARRPDDPDPAAPAKEARRRAGPAAGLGKTA